MFRFCTKFILRPCTSLLLRSGKWLKSSLLYFLLFKQIWSLLRYNEQKSISMLVFPGIPFEPLIICLLWFEFTSLGSQLFWIYVSYHAVTRRTSWIVNSIWCPTGHYFCPRWRIWLAFPFIKSVFTWFIRFSRVFYCILVYFWLLKFLVRLNRPFTIRCWIFILT